MTAAGASTTTRRRRSGRTIAAAFVGAALVIAGVVVATRTDGYPQRDVRVFAGTRWLVDRRDGSVVLADAASGRATARIVTERAGHLLDTVESPAGAFLVDRTSREVVSIDQKGVKLAESHLVESLDERSAFVLGAGADGAVAAARDGSAITIPQDGVPVLAELPATTSDRMISTDGAIWTKGLAGRIQRTTADHTRQVMIGAGDDAALGAVGSHGVLLDRTNHTVVWLDTDHAVSLAPTLELSDAVIQAPGAEAPCIWVGAADQLLCVSTEGVTRTLRVDRFAFRPTDRLLAAAGVVAVLRTDGSVVRIDPITGAVDPVTEIGWDDRLRPAIATDEVVIWIDDPDGGTALALTSRSTRVISKQDESAAEFDDEGVPTASNSRSGEARTSLVPAEAEPAGQVRPTGPDDNGVDDPPVAVRDRARVRQDSTVTINVAANDFDPDGGPVAVIGVTRAAHGSAQQLNATSVSYTPEPGSLASDSFEYTIVDTGGQSATATVTVTVFPRDSTNEPPVARDDSGATAPARPVTVDVLANDTDPEGDPLVIVEATIDAADGQAEVTTAAGGRSQLRITPAPGLDGRQIEVTYRARDTAGLTSEPARVQVRVNSGSEGNHPPIPVSDVAQVTAGGTVTIPVLANDIDDDNDVLAIDSVKLTGRDGAAVIREGSIIYTAPASLVGPVSFTYVVSDPAGTTGRGKVLVNIVAAGAANQAPVALPDVEEAGPGRNTFSPLLNDIDPDNDPLVITDVTQERGSEQERLRAGSITHDGTHVYYEPVSTGPATARLTYTISDGRGRSSSATITVTVRDRRLPQGPVARSDVGTITPGETKSFDVRSNDSDPNGDPLAVDIVGGCGGAGCTVTTDERIRFVAPAQSTVTSYSIAYEVTNSVGQTDTAVLRLDVAAAPASAQPPTAIPGSVTVTAGGSTTVDVLRNVTDPDTPPNALVLDRVTTADPTIEVVIRDGKVELSAAAGPRRSTTFQYVVSDPDGLTATGTVAVSVQLPANRAPIVPARQVRITAGESRSVDFLDGVIDPDATTAELRLVARPKVDQGANLVEVSSAPTSPGSYRITASAGVSGNALITFEVTDGSDARSPGTLTVVVAPVQNRAPIARPDVATTAANTAVDIDVLANDEDPDGDAITVRLDRSPSIDQGTATIDGRLIRFTPHPQFSGNATFSYQAADPGGRFSSAATVTVRVAPCTDRPANLDDVSGEFFTPFDTPTTVTVASGLTTPVRIDSFSGGTVTQPTPGVLTFVPTPGSNGFGTVQYSVSNSCGERQSALLTIDVNRAPRVDAVTITSPLGRPVDIPVTRFASDEEPLLITAATSPAGDVSISADRTRLVLTPRVTAPTLTSIAVTVSDPGGLPASGTITLDLVASTNAAPQAADDDVTIPPGVATTLDLLRNDSDPDDALGTLTIQLGSSSVALPAGSMSLALGPDHRSVVATTTDGAHGRATFSYRAVDPSGAASTTATVTVTVNRAPRPVTFDRAIVAGTSDEFSAYDPGVDSDPDKGDATVSLVTSRTDDRVVVDFLPGLRIRITVPIDVPPGDVVVKYTISDYYGGVGIGTLTVRVLAGATPTTPPPPATAAPQTTPPAAALPTGP